MTTPAYVPAFADLVQGVDYEIVTDLAVEYSNSFTEHPIEDPQNSFIFDHNRENPLSLNLSITVFSENCNQGVDDRGADHIARFYQRLLELKRLQSVDATEAITVVTGIRSFTNMIITNIIERRESNSPSASLFDIELVQFRFARFPRRSEVGALHLASDGPFSFTSDRLVTEADRPIIEQTSLRQSVRSRTLGQNGENIVRASLLAIARTF